jgi:pyruvate formate lyase activating enzyme
MRVLGSIVCDICPRSCEIAEGETGFCKVRKNENGENVDGYYGLVSRRCRDLIHGVDSLFFPGCNVKCWFCGVPFLSSHFGGDVTEYEKVTVEQPSRETPCRRLDFCGGEPTLHYECVLETARMAHERGIFACLATAGFISERVIRDLSRVVDSVTVSPKCSMSPAVYDRLGIDRNVVFRSIEIAWREARHVWIYDLIGPGFMPSDGEVRAFGLWLSEIGAKGIHYLVQPLCLPVKGFGEGFTVLTLLPGDDPCNVLIRATRVGRILAGECGLSNVFFLDAGGSSANRFWHYPSMRRMTVSDTFGVKAN